MNTFYILYDCQVCLCLIPIIPDWFVIEKHQNNCSNKNAPAECCCIFSIFSTIPDPDKRPPPENLLHNFPHISTWHLVPLESLLHNSPQNIHVTWLCGSNWIGKINCEKTKHGCKRWEVLFSYPVLSLDEWHWWCWWWDDQGGRSENFVHVFLLSITHKTISLINRNFLNSQFEPTL